jgi:hypothetical protein
MEGPKPLRVIVPSDSPHAEGFVNNDVNVGIGFTVTGTFTATAGHPPALALTV